MNFENWLQSQEVKKKVYVVNSHVFFSFESAIVNQISKTTAKNDGTIIPSFQELKLS